MDRNEENKVIGLNDQILEELNKAIDDMTLFDDDLMSKVFDGNKEGREIMCESFERLADKVAEERAEQRAKQTTVNNIRLMMKNLKCSLEEALNTLEITGKDRAIIAKQLQKSI